ncbi:MAG: prepilin-type cleavage/methylation domain-containing protein [Synechococcaceae cyanobacterium]|nr:prepilin-type cleavage/methylation domain-containing protein [Synechococcaceae cyanobacterium]
MSSQAFTLVELLLALTLGVVVCAAMVQLLLSESRGSALLVQRLRAGLEQRRVLELIREDVQRSSTVSLAAVSPPACSLAGRAVVLHLEGVATPVTYSVGSPPSSIWQGQVLMRCGSAFGLDGQPSPGMALNRVVLDGLPAGGLRVVALAGGRLELELQQELPERHGHKSRIASTLVMAAP